MHEIGLAYEILKTAESHSQGKVITCIGITVGSLSGVEPESLKFALNALKADTLANSADVEITFVKAEGVCAECGKNSLPDTFFAQCPYCKSPVLEIVKGEEFALKYIDVE